MNKRLSKVLLYFAIAVLQVTHPVCADEFTVAVRAKSGIEFARDKWQPTIDYLNEQIPEHHFTLKPVLSLEEMNEMAIGGQFDFVITNPSSYVEMARQGGADALVTLLNKRANTIQDRFGTVIFVHALNEELIRMQDIRGKRLMAVSEHAFGGWRVAWHELLRNDIDPYRDLESLTFAEGRTQEEVVYAVLDRVVDVGVVRTDQLERMQQRGLIDLRYFRILNSRDTKGFPFFHSTDLYPEWPFAAFEFVRRDVVKQVKEALMQITADMPAAVHGQYIGWQKPSSYDSVTELMRELGIFSNTGRK